MLYVSQELYDNVKKVAALADSRPHPLGRFNLPAMFGMEICPSPLLPLRFRVRTIIQKDRFATYEERDMDWAVPLGLAEWGPWKEEVTHAIEADMREFFAPFLPAMDAAYARMREDIERRVAGFFNVPVSLYDFPHRSF